MRPVFSAVPVRVATAAAFVFLSAAVPAEPQAGSGVAEQPVEAVWAPRELNFTFLGFTAHYSCDGLQARMQKVLLMLGARAADLDVRLGPCAAPLGRPDRFPNVRVKMYVLVPAAGQTGTADAPTVAAHWKMVNLTASKDLVKEAGDCELIEQVKQSVLPLFATRDVFYQSTCIPYQLTIGGTQLRAQVLVPDEQGAKGAAAP
ncbi:MAG TPA: hypothetical protein VED45_02070 [Steroidobacteraceae bacterium]|nr:hypothetical protein [Steroidobacteraceae bacterium]